MGIFDVTLRHVVQHHARELVQGLVPADASFEIVGWIDTQVTALERRLDKALDLRLNGKPRILCPEFQLDFPADMSARVYEYEALLFMGLRAAGEPLPPPMHSVVFVLRGRRKPWPPGSELRRGWPETRWSGLRFRVEAVYQRTVEQLRAHPGVFWLVFTPLARNATAEAMLQVIETIRQRVASGEERAELYAAMLVLATIDPWGHNLRKEIEAMLDEVDKLLLREIPMLREAFEEGEAKGEARGEARGTQSHREDASGAVHAPDGARAVRRGAGGARQARRGARSEPGPGHRRQARGRRARRVVARSGRLLTAAARVTSPPAARRVGTMRRADNVPGQQDEGAEGLVLGG